MGIVVLDIGNSKDKFALLTGTPPRVKAYRAFDKIPDILPSISENVNRVLISSVVPSKIDKWKKILIEQGKIEEVEIIDKSFLKKLPMRGPDPNEVGMDRILGILGGLVRTTPPFILIDAGSAITFNVVDKDGVFIGGFISPGINKLFESIFKCPQIKPFDFQKINKDLIIGTSTKDSIAAGIMNYIKGSFEIASTEVYKLLGCEPEILITGGNGEILKNWIDKGKYFPYLVLEGIAIATI